MLSKAGMAMALAACVWIRAAAQESTSPQSDSALKHKTLEELLDLPVISVNRRLTPFAESATAIEVITDDEIRHSGAMNFPDVLRLATGVHVAQADGRTWGVTARGFNTTTANKMLVLMDGRTLYTPLFGGVLWDAQDYLLADVDRIEVIRGPGATMWGANAVNGVINIITKTADQTQGTYVSSTVGDELRSQGAIRYGDQIGDETFFRVYAKYTDFDSLALRNGQDAHDERQFGKTGFRLDSFKWDNNVLTVQGDTYHGWNGAAGRDDEDIGGGNILGQWTRFFSDTSDLHAQVYYDRVDRQLPHIFTEARDTYDVDLQYRFEPASRNNVLVGLNYRWSGDDIRNNVQGPLQFRPDDRDVHLIGGFVQDEITLLPDKLGLTLGSKLEHNDFSGFEVQPSARIAYTPVPRQTLWSAVSRAVRTPSQLDEDVYAFGTTPLGRTLLVRGDPGFDSEELTAYELGYRIQPVPILTFDIATFYNDYDHLRSQEPRRSAAGTVLVLDNQLSGSTYGAEVAANLQLLRQWRLHAGYTAFEKHLRLDGDSRDPTGGVAEGNDPSHMVVLRSSVDFFDRLEFDTTLRYVDRLPNPHVPAYLALDVRVGWFVTPDLELSIVGRNLLDDRHPEFGANTPARREVERGVYGRVTWRF